MRRRLAIAAGLAAAALATVPVHAALTSDGQFGGPGSGPGQFASPSDVAVGPGGDAYVADQGNHRVQRFSADGAYIGEWGGLGTAPGQFNEPVSIDTDAAGNVYVVDLNNARVQKFDPEGRFLMSIGSHGTADGQFQGGRLWGVAVDRHGNIYAGDSGLARIQKFDASGNFVTKWGSPGSGPGEFDGPRGIGIDRDGNVYVAERNNHRVQKFTADGRFVRQWGGPGRRDGEQLGSYDVEIDESGNVFVAEFDGARISVYSTDGAFLDKTTNFQGTSFKPRGIGLGPKGRLYAADQGPNGNRVVRFAARGLPPGIETADSIEQLSDPQPFKEINVEAQGTVLVRLPRGAGAGAAQAGSKGMIPLTDAAQLPVGSIVDTSKGKVVLESAADSRGSRTQTARFSDGAFQMLQRKVRRGRRPVTEMVLKGGSFRASCSSRRGAKGSAGGPGAHDARHSRRVRRLWGRGRGNFRTRGRYSSATVRGTTWLVEDRCDGTLTRVRRGRVTVTDFRARRTVRLRSGQRYLAKRTR